MVNLNLLDIAYEGGGAADTLPPPPCPSIRTYNIQGLDNLLKLILETANHPSALKHATASTTSEDKIWSKD